MIYRQVMRRRPSEATNRIPSSGEILPAMRAGNEHRQQRDARAEEGGHDERAGGDAQAGIVVP